MPSDGTDRYMTISTAVKATDSDSLQLEKLQRGSLHCVSQCQKLLDQVTEASFCESRPGISSIGAHMRHVLDRYFSFFNGLSDLTVDYDARKRDPAIESNLESARFAVVSIERRLKDLDLKANTALTVKETVHHLSSQVLIESSLARELMGLITHTTHHLAIIAMIARAQGYELEDDFGKAPSTLVYERS